jgi:hypothetical protein
MIKYTCARGRGALFKEVYVLRTLGVLVAGMLLGITLLASLAWARLAINRWQQPPAYDYYLILALTGCAVGLLVGFLQKYKAGFVAMICLIPQAFVQYVNRFSRPATGFRLVLLLLGTALELSFAFAVAHMVAARRRANLSSR